jgi:hypothetical protein
MNPVMSYLRRHPWWLAALLPAASALVYALYTHQIWEDYLITFRHTENLVNGKGLVYQPGERVHGFTSVLNTLLPALPFAVTHSFAVTIWTFRLCSLAVLVGGLAVLWRALAEKLGAGRFELWLGAVLVATSVKIVAFSVNGQESGLLVGFLAMALGFALRLDEPRGWIRLGLAWAGLLYTRPDSPLCIAIVAVIAWQCGAGEPRARLKPVVQAGALAAIAFLPWVLIAWSYYGSPVPHTVTAKAGDSFLVANNIMATLSAMCAQLVEVLIDVFGAIYGMGDWPQLLGLGALVGAVFAATRWVRPWRDRFTALCSLGLGGLLVYFLWLNTQRTAYPWYFGPASLLAIVVVSRTAGAAWERRTRWSRALALGGGGTLALVSAWIFVLGNQHAQRQQAEVEDNIRKPIGLWLKANAAPGDTVFLEPIGYIGYYSGMKILDYPGLVAPEVVRARHETKAGFAELPTILKPTWIIARRGELERLRTIEGITSNYLIAQVWDRTAEVVQKYGQYPGATGVLFDSYFIALRRKPDAK